MQVAQKESTLIGLKSGSVKILVSTNALEAGLDIPALDCCLILSYPGSRMSFLQRVGRAGRSRPGIAMFLPLASSVVDCFFSSNPTALLDSSAEVVICNPDYPSILGRHLWCAAAEKGISHSELLNLFGSKAKHAIKVLVNQGQVIFLFFTCSHK